MCQAKDGARGLFQAENLTGNLPRLYREVDREFTGNLI